MELLFGITRAGSQRLRSPRAAPKEPCCFGAAEPPPRAAARLSRAAWLVGPCAGSAIARCRLHPAPASPAPLPLQQGNHCWPEATDFHPHASHRHWQSFRGQKDGLRLCSRNRLSPQCRPEISPPSPELSAHGPPEGPSLTPSNALDRHTLRKARAGPRPSVVSPFAIPWSRFAVTVLSRNDALLLQAAGRSERLPASDTGENPKLQL